MFCLGYLQKAEQSKHSTSHIQTLIQTFRRKHIILPTAHFTVYYATGKYAFSEQTCIN